MKSKNTALIRQLCNVLGKGSHEPEMQVLLTALVESDLVAMILKREEEGSVGSRKREAIIKAMLRRDRMFAIGLLRKLRRQYGGAEKIPHEDLENFAEYCFLEGSESEWNEFCCPDPDKAVKILSQSDADLRKKNAALEQGNPSDYDFVCAALQEFIDTMPNHHQNKLRGLSGSMYEKIRNGSDRTWIELIKWESEENNWSI